jgi:phosphoesterase RecJ-like protein
MITEQTTDTVLKLISSAEKFVLTTHVSPDGDAIGSVIAFGDYLRAKGKQVEIINHSPTPFNLTFLDKDEKIRVYAKDLEANNEIINNTDIIFLLDTNEFHRTKSLEQVLQNSPAMKICIDHHAGIKPEMFNAIVSDTSYAATCQMLYDFIKRDSEEYINADVASALYVGIMTDTGSFRHPRTDSDVFRICADLLDKGADPVFLYDEICNKVSKEMMQLQAAFLGGLEFFFDGRMILGKVTQEDFKKYGLNVDHIEGFTSLIMSISGVKVGIMMVELRDNIKLSFRSKGNIPANAMAIEYGGGGHFNAGGANVYGVTEDELKPQLIETVKKYIDIV